MRRKITVIGTDGASGEVARRLRDCDLADVVGITRDADWDDAAGSDVVVLTRGADVHAVSGRIASRCPMAVIVVATDDVLGDCRAAIDESLLPRGRVIGVAGEHDLAAGVRRIVEAVLLDRGSEIEAAVFCRGELGVQDDVAIAPVRLGEGGVRAIG